MSQHQVTVDEIGPDRSGDLLATLIDDDGRSIVLPAVLLPDGTRVGDVLTLTLERDSETTEDRARRVSELQRRLFSRRNRPTSD